ncbi:type II toxin-antitoxin system death-on-curing family toxin [Methylobacterium sp. JK268]
MAWIDREVVIALHSEQLARYGGSPGLRDGALLDSALARALNLAAYGDPDVFDLAAAYAYGLARNHPFIDGNKRVSLIIADLFLMRHGHEIDCDPDELYQTWMSLAAGAVDEGSLAEFLRLRSRELRISDD